MILSSSEPYSLVERGPIQHLDNCQEKEKKRSHVVISRESCDVKECVRVHASACERVQVRASACDSNLSSSGRAPIFACYCLLQSACTGFYVHYLQYYLLANK